MTIYKRQKKNLFKWVLAFIIFVLVLTVTFDEVYGLSLQPTPPLSGNSSTNQPHNWVWYDLDGVGYPAEMHGSGTRTTSSPPEIPEPSTVFLLATGLAAWRLIRRKRVVG